MKAIGFLMVMLAAGVPAFAGTGANFYGFSKAEILQAEGAPVKLISGLGTGFQDGSSTKSSTGAFLGGTGTGAYQSGSGRYDVSLQATKPGVIAVEVEWAAVNAFGEVQGSRKASFSWKNQLSPGSTKREHETAERIGNENATYRLRVMRVKFVSGEVWTAPEPASPEAAPAK